jgi:endoglucanase Acf2
MSLSHFRFLSKSISLRKTMSRNNLDEVKPSSTCPATSTAISAITETPPNITTTSVIPPDNIFVPIQADEILPRIPIGQHHPVPRKGIQDDEYRTLHTNKFYANAFLGEQNQPVWTHPYSLWWGKGGKEPDYFATWGMNVGHVEAEDLTFGEGDPAKVYLHCWFPRGID